MSYFKHTVSLQQISEYKEDYYEQQSLDDVNPMQANVTGSGTLLGTTDKAEIKLDHK
jgi:hypothetical protein